MSLVHEMLPNHKKTWGYLWLEPKWLQIDAVKQEIGDLVSRCTDLKVEAGRLLLSFVLNHLVYNPDTPMPDIRFGANGQMCNFFSSLIANPRRRDLLNRNTCNWAALNEYIEAHYVPPRPVDLFWCDRRGYSNMVTTLASAHNDDCARHITTNLPSRLKQQLRHKFRKHLAFCLEEDDFNTLAIYVFALIDPPEDIEEMPPYPAEIIDNCGIAELVVYYPDYYETRARQYILCNLPMDKPSLQNNWHLYLKSMWRILRTFENNHEMYQEEYLLNNEGPLLNVYALLPLNGFTQKHILITSNVLKEIYVAANLPDVRQMNAQALWSHCFNLNKVSNNRNQRRRFGYSITSDGVGSSDSVLRPAYPAPPASRCGFAFDGTGQQELDVNMKLALSGLTSIVACFWLLLVVLMTESQMFQPSRRRLQMESMSWFTRLPDGVKRMEKIQVKRSGLNGMKELQRSLMPWPTFLPLNQLCFWESSNICECPDYFKLAEDSGTDADGNVTDQVLAKKAADYKVVVAEQSQDVVHGKELTEEEQTIRESGGWNSDLATKRANQAERREAAGARNGGFQQVRGNRGRGGRGGRGRGGRGGGRGNSRQQYNKYVDNNAWDVGAMGGTFANGTFTMNEMVNALPTHDIPINALPQTLWQYKDPQGDIQGPFSGLEMMEWYEAGYFPATLLIRRADFVEEFHANEGWLKLEDYMQKLNDVIGKPVGVTFFGPPLNTSK
ncbi:hypothetical protein MIR68_008181 [Amoeboaphelidium protococcarum]|nr:hypothetical protein MIR68_008181 [Amoeboaphelidium protococcarum]